MESKSLRSRAQIARRLSYRKSVAFGNCGDLLGQANALMIPWITAVIRQRVSPDGKTLCAVTEASAWMENNQTGEFAPFGAFAGSKAEASWLPDEASARGWQAVLAKGEMVVIQF